MARPKKNQDKSLEEKKLSLKDELDELDEDDLNLDEDDDELEDYDSNESNYENLNKIETIDKFFNTESFLRNIQMTLLGYRIKNNQYVNTGNGVARTVIIDKIINIMRSKITTQNILSDLDEKQINRILLETCKEVIFTIYDEESVEEEDVEYIVNIVDHSSEIFMNILRDGGGVDSSQRFFAQHAPAARENNPNNEPFLRIGTSENDFIRIGGKR